MKQVLSFVLALAAVTDALPPPAGHAYQKPGTKDVRSPCPGLNSLANHGWINRNGKGITVPQLVTGGYSGLGIGQDFMTTIGGLALFAPAKPNGKSFNLDELKEHNFPIEHDVSLTRKDYYFNKTDSSLTFNRKYYNEFMSYYKGLTVTTVESSARARENRINYTLANNPERVYGPQAFLFGYGETALYTLLMGSSPLAQGAPVKYVQSLFLENRLPYELGWQPSVVPVTLPALGSYAFEVFFSKGTTQQLPIGMEVLTRGTYGMFLADQLILAGKIKNITAT